MVRRLILSERAWHAIEMDCRAHRITETGGALIGARVNDEIVVPFVVPAGPEAVKTSVAFAPDTPWQQGLLDFLFDRFGGVTYVGDVHLHPGDFDRPSRWDLRTARRIVTEAAWDTPTAVFPIAVNTGDDVKIRAYLMTREEPDFVEIPVAVVPETDRRIRRLLVNTTPRSGKSMSNREDYERAVSAHRRRGGPRGGGFIRRVAARLRPRPAR